MHQQRVGDITDAQGQDGVPFDVRVFDPERECVCV